MKIEQAIEIHSFAKQIDVQVKFYEAAGMWAVAYLDTITTNPERAWRDMKALEFQVLDVA